MWTCLLSLAAIADQSNGAPEDFGADGVNDLDMDAYRKSPLEHVLLLDAVPSLLLLNEGSPSYRLRYPGSNRRVGDAYSLRLEGGLQARLEKLFASLSGSAGAIYSGLDDSLDHSEKLLEAYAKFVPNASLSLAAGKRNVKWGKGYVYNPVSLAGRQRDVNDIEASLEGYWMLSAEAIKSFPRPLETLAATLALIPVVKDMNQGYAEDETLSLASQLYFLLWDTDLDVYGAWNTGGRVSAGFDVSRNLLSNLEAHAELAYHSEIGRQVFQNDSTAVPSEGSGAEILAGTRYLAPFNTTFIFEFLHRTEGYTAGEMEAYRSALEGAAGRPIQDPLRRKVAGLSRFYSGQFLMRNYFYAKASHPDFLNVLYFNPALYALVNAEDGSVMGGVEMSYVRFAHLSLLLRIAAFAGDGDTEYGMKPVRQRTEFRMRAML